jgi:hypothetical protein
MDPVPVDIKFKIGVGNDGDVNASLTCFKTQPNVPVLFDHRAFFQFKQASSFYITPELCQYHLQVRRLSKVCCIAILLGRPGDGEYRILFSLRRPERNTAPSTLINPPVEMRDPSASNGMCLLLHLQCVKKEGQAYVTDHKLRLSREITNKSTAILRILFFIDRIAAIFR